MNCTFSEEASKSGLVKRTFYTRNSVAIASSNDEELSDATGMTILTTKDRTELGFRGHVFIQFQLEVRIFVSL